MDKKDMQAQINEVLSKYFNSIDDILNNDIFKMFLSTSIREAISTRDKRPDPKPGYHYKRDWVDIMRGDRQLNREFFLQHIKDIWLKKSNLSSLKRQAIQVICDEALNKAVKRYIDIKDEKQIICSTPKSIAVVRKPKNKKS